MSMDKFKNMSSRIRRRANSEVGESSKQNEQLHDGHAAPTMPQLDPTHPRTFPPPPFGPGKPLLPPESARVIWSHKAALGSPSATTHNNQYIVGSQQNAVDLTQSPFSAGQNPPNLTPASPQVSLFNKPAPLSPSRKSKLRPPKFLRRHEDESEPNPWLKGTSYASSSSNLQHGKYQPFLPANHPMNTPPQSWVGNMPFPAHTGFGNLAAPSAANHHSGIFNPPVPNYDIMPDGGDEMMDVEYPEEVLVPGPISRSRNSSITGESTLDVDSKSPTDTNGASADINDVSLDILQAAEDPNIEGMEELRQIREFARGAVNGSCPACHRRIGLSASDVTKLTRYWCCSPGACIIGVRCTSTFCNKHICPGCGKAITSDTMQAPRRSFNVSGMAFNTYWCCEAGRLVGIWALACGWTAPSTNILAPVASVVEKVRRSQSHGHTHGHHVKFSPNAPSATAKGVGYGGDRLDMIPRLSSRLHRSHPDKTMQTDAREDLVRETYFRLLTALLPAKDTSNIYELPLHLICPILARSPLLEQAALMLGSDAIAETARQFYLYDGMLDLVDLLGAHVVTASLIYNKRNIYYERTGSLFGVSFPTGKSQGGLSPKDTGKSLTTLLGSLASQARSVLRFAQANPTEFLTGGGRNLLALSRRLTQLSEQHEAGKQLFQTEMDVCNGGQEINLTEWHRENSVKEMADEAMLSNFAFSQEAQAGVNTIPIPGRMKRLITELSTLRTSLPEGIYMCHGSSRLDIMKVLIIGPKGTPYEHGFFQFDLLCPMDYPKSPPKMSFKNTGGGRVRFNPNLYEDGKICLSLLGTWSGEPWQPERSTILQVLVSIQSMILCQEPWYNEPGRELTKSNAMSVRYNEDVRSLTIDITIRPWITALTANDTDPKPSNVNHPASMWGETARLYLRANAKDICKAANDAASQSKNPKLRDVAMCMNNALRTQGYLD